jgi:DNA polymerase-4
MAGLCRDCDAEAPGPTCPACGSARVVRHEALFALTIGHIDCDAFYATIEKRDDPTLRDKPVIVGGTGARGVVSTACYIARLYGVRSAMPMATARKLCPHAVVLPPDMRKYAATSAAVRTRLEALTPLVKMLSIDEAVVDLAGTESLHHAPPAIVLNRFARAVETELGITVSIGLAPNRLLAKLAAERGKPRGFCVLGSEAPTLLAGELVALLPGVGPVTVKRLGQMGITRVGQLAALDEATALRKLGDEGMALVARARFIDPRPVRPERDTKSISAETTFTTDLHAKDRLEAELWRLCEKLGRRLKREALAAGGVTLKLKTAGFATRTRAQRLPNPTQLPETLFEAGRALLTREADGTAFRLIGIGAAPLAEAGAADKGDLADDSAPRRAARQGAIDKLRAKFGERAIGLGRGLRKPGNNT